MNPENHWRVKKYARDSSSMNWYALYVILQEWKFFRISMYPISVFIYSMYQLQLLNLCLSSMKLKLLYHHRSLYRRAVLSLLNQSSISILSMLSKQPKYYPNSSQGDLSSSHPIDPVHLISFQALKVYISNFSFINESSLERLSWLVISYSIET